MVEVADRHSIVAYTGRPIPHTRCDACGISLASRGRFLHAQPRGEQTSRDRRGACLPVTLSMRLRTKVCRKQSTSSAISQQIVFHNSMTSTHPVSVSPFLEKKPSYSNFIHMRQGGVTRSFVHRRHPRHSPEARRYNRTRGTQLTLHPFPVGRTDEERQWSFLYLSYPPTSQFYIPGPLTPMSDITSSPTSTASPFPSDVEKSYGISQPGFPTDIGPKPSNLRVRWWTIRFVISRFT